MALRVRRHHLPLLCICVIAAFAVYRVLPAGGALFRMSMATAYVALGLLVATLAIGALNILRGRRNPVSIDLRRDIGIWCALVTLAHVAIGLQVHMAGMLLYFFHAPGGGRTTLRLDLFGLANHAGLIAALLITLLLALSNDLSLRRLGVRRWKFWQRSNYAAAGLILLHGIAYMYIEKRILSFVLLFAAMAGTALAIQFMGLRRRARVQNAERARQ